MRKEDYVKRVFRNIASCYDSANTRISFGMHRVWKAGLVRRMIRHLPQGGQVLDLCCGTGDIAIALAKRRGDIRVTGLDFSPAMLRIAEERGSGYGNILWVRGDAMKLPFPDHTFHAAAVSFGLRNTEDYGQVLEEMSRVVKPGGRVYTLDSFLPENPFVCFFYKVYFCRIMPYVGGGIKHRREYRWLWESTRDFVTKAQLVRLFEQCHLEQVRCKSYLLGACALHSGRKGTSG